LPSGLKRSVAHFSIVSYSWSFVKDGACISVLKETLPSSKVIAPARYLGSVCAIAMNGRHKSIKKRIFFIVIYLILYFNLSKDRNKKKEKL